MCGESLTITTANLCETGTRDHGMKTSAESLDSGMDELSVVFWEREDLVCQFLTYSASC